jgi:hypothetical protein
MDEPVATKEGVWPPPTVLRPGITWQDVKAGFTLRVDGECVNDYWNHCLPDALVDDIVRIADVPTRFRSTVAKKTPIDIGMAMYEFEQRRLEWNGRNTKTQLVTVAQLAKQLASALTSLDEAPLMLLEDAIFELTHDRRKKFKALYRIGGISGDFSLRLYGLKTDAFEELIDYNIPDSTAPLRGVIHTLADAANAAILKAKSRERKDAWRPKDSVSNPCLYYLIRRLYTSVVKEAHGKLAVRKGKRGGELKGTLPAILAILRPYLPNIIPAKLSYSTLRRVPKKQNKSSRNFELTGVFAGRSPRTNSVSQKRTVAQVGRRANTCLLNDNRAWIGRRRPPDRTRLLNASSPASNCASFSVVAAKCTFGAC